MNELYAFAATYALKRPVRINIRLPSKLPNTIIAFSDLCVKHNIIDLYIWLSWRFPKFFVEKEICMQQKNYALGLIEETLMVTGATFNGGNSLNDDYIETRKKLAKLTNNTFLPPSGDLDCFKSVRESTRLYLEQLESIAPTFRRKQWGKVSREDVQDKNKGPREETSAQKPVAAHNSNSAWKKRTSESPSDTTKPTADVTPTRPKVWQTKPTALAGSVDNNIKKTKDSFPASRNITPAKIPVAKKTAIHATITSDVLQMVGKVMEATGGNAK